MSEGAERDMRIWKMYYDEGMTLRAIGEKVGVSTERVRQLRNRCDSTNYRGLLRQLYRERDILDSRIAWLMATFPKAIVSANAAVEKPVDTEQ